MPTNFCNNFVIVGGGAIGKYLAALLCHAEQKVTIKARRNAYVLKSGYRLFMHCQINGIITHPEIPARPAIIQDYSELDLNVSRIVILACRSYQLEFALAELKKSQLKIEAIIPAGNGLFWEKTIGKEFPKTRIISMVITHPVKNIVAGVEVTHPTGKGGIALAPLDAENRQLCNELADLFRQSKIETIVHENYTAMRASKLLLNLVGNVTCAITNLSAEKLFRNAAVSKVEKISLKELLWLMDKLKIKLVDLPGYPAKKLQLIRLMVLYTPLWLFMKKFGGEVGRARGDKKASLHLVLGNAGDDPILTEIDEYSGAVVRLGEENNIDCPVNRQLTAITKTISQHPNLRAKYRANPDILYKEVFGKK